MKELIETMREWGRVTTRFLNLLDDNLVWATMPEDTLKEIKRHLHNAIECMADMAEAVEPWVEEE